MNVGECGLDEIWYVEKVHMFMIHIPRDVLTDELVKYPQTGGNL